MRAQFRDARVVKRVSGNPSEIYAPLINVPPRQQRGKHNADGDFVSIAAGQKPRVFRGYSAAFLGPAGGTAGWSVELRQIDAPLELFLDQLQPRFEPLDAPQQVAASVAATRRAWADAAPRDSPGADAGR